MLKGGSAWMPDNQVNGVDFVLPFRFADGAWHLGTRGPVTLRIAEVINLVTAKILRLICKVVIRGLKKNHCC